MTIYISGCITNKDTLNPNEVLHKIERFEKASQRLKGAGYTVVNPCNLPHMHNHSWEAYLKEDLRAMLKCDAVYMLEGWKESKGAITEYEIAKLLKLEVLYE